MLSQNQPSVNLRQNNQNPSRSTTSSTQTIDRPISTPDVGQRPIEQRPIATDHNQPMNGSSNSNGALSRALVGGLVGATLGLLVGRKVSEGFNRASKGVGRAFGTIGEGLSTTGKGVGEVAKSIGDGVSYAVVEGTSEAAQNISHGVQKVVSGANKAVQQTEENVSDGIQQAADITSDVIQKTGNAVSQKIDNAASSMPSSNQEPDLSLMDWGEPTSSVPVGQEDIERYGFEDEQVEQQPFNPPTVTNEDGVDVVMDFYESVERSE
jgi:gas vesicle protein